MLDNPWTRLIQILLSRFIINLRQAGPSSTASDPFTLQHSTIAFRMRNLTMNDVVGNLGEPLDFVEYKVDEDDEGSDSVQARGPNSITEQGEHSELGSRSEDHVGHGA